MLILFLVQFRPFKTATLTDMSAFTTTGRIYFLSAVLKSAGHGQQVYIGRRINRTPSFRRELRTKYLSTSIPHASGTRRRIWRNDSISSCWCCLSSEFRRGRWATVAKATYGSCSTVRSFLRGHSREWIHNNRKLSNVLLLSALVSLCKISNARAPFRHQIPPTSLRIS